jgi:16S rRNA (cytidine1402-2'-O)-methyltransferase
VIDPRERRGAPATGKVRDEHDPSAPARDDVTEERGETPDARAVLDAHETPAANETLDADEAPDTREDSDADRAPAAEDASDAPDVHVARRGRRTRAPDVGGLLSIVATPIGNLEDITLRALRTLREADLVLAEDTRRTRVLCQQHGLSCQLRSFHAYSDARAVEHVVDELAQGKHIALVTDAGTPLLSDPGAALVAAANRAGLRVESVPGPSAITAALTVAGVPVDTFRFLGFLPRSGKRRREALQEICADRAASVVFESPQRLAHTLQELSAVLEPEREIAVCRELTKLHEQVVRGPAAQLAEHFHDGTRGEVTLVIAGRTRAATSEIGEAELDERIRAKLTEGSSPRDAAHALAAETGLRKQAIYARIQILKGST